MKTCEHIVCNSNDYLYHYQTGGVMPYYQGMKFQRGYGWTAQLARYALPFIKKQALNLGKNLLKSGVKVLSDVGSGDKKLQDSLVQRSKEALVSSFKNFRNTYTPPPAKKTKYTLPAKKTKTHKTTPKKRQYKSRKKLDLLT